MEALIYFALWAGLIFLMMRFGCGAHIMGHAHGGQSAGKDGQPGDDAEMRWVAPEKDVDPVCGQTIQTDKAKPSVYDGVVYYFCSRECREIFEAAPDQYVGSQSSQEARQLEHSHV